MPRILISVEELYGNLQFLTQEVSIAPTLLPPALKVQWEEVANNLSTLTGKPTARNASSQEKPPFLMPLMLRNNLNFAIGAFNNASTEERQIMLQEGIEIEIPEEDLTDPITLDYYKNPRVISCGHVIGNESVSKITKCPCCRVNINQNDTQPLPEMLANQLAPVLSLPKFPEIDFDFNFSDFYHALDQYKYNPAAFSKYLPLLKSEKFLYTHVTEDVVFPEERYPGMSWANRKGYTAHFQNQTILYILASDHDGKRILASDPITLSKISTEELETVFLEGAYRGKSALHCLVDDHIDRKGNKIPLERQALYNPVFRGKITPQGLNATVPNGLNDAGQSPLWEIASPYNICRTLLMTDPILRGKITSDGLNAVNGLHDWMHTNTSPLLFLVKDNLGRQLIIEDVTLRSKITSAGLNTFNTCPAHVDDHEKDDYERSSPLLCLVKEDSGLQLIINDEVLRNKVTEDGLNTYSGSRNCWRRESVLSTLVESEAGLNLLLVDVQLRSKINSHGLNSLAKGGLCWNQSPLSLLIASDVGLQLIVNDEILRNKITSEGLDSTVRWHANHKSGENSVLLSLILHEQGYQLIMEDSVLRSKTTPVGLNTSYSCPNNADTNEEHVRHEKSALLIFTEKETGIQLLVNDETLRGNISAAGLNTIGYTGESPLSHLIKTEMGLQLLINDPVLHGKITVEGLNAIIGNNGKSVLFELLSSAVGRQLIISDVELRSKINAAGLNAVVQDGDYREKSALDWLYSTSEGQKLLANDAVLRNKITQKPINSMHIKDTIGDLKPVQMVNVSKSKSRMIHG
jgi:hypothetical protein